MVVMTAAASLAILMMVVMVFVFILIFIVMVVMMVLMFLIFVVMVVMMVLMLLIFVVMVVMMMLMLLIFIVIVVMMMVMMLVLVLIIVMMVMMVMMLVLLFLLCKYKICERYRVLHRCKNLRAGEIIPGSRDDYRIRIMLSEKCCYCLQLLLADILRTAEYDGICALYLIVVEFAEILHIHLALVRICNGYHAVDLQPGILRYVLYCKRNIGKLADTGGLNDDAIRMELLYNLAQSCVKISHQRTADAAGIHLCDVDAGIL